MFCPNCGNKLVEGAEFCSECGKRINQKVEMQEKGSLGRKECCHIGGKDSVRGIGRVKKSDGKAEQGN